MLTFDKALDQLIEAGWRAHSDLDTVQVPVERALGRVLATDIFSALDVPPRDNSAMDGYAFCYADAADAGFTLPVSQRIPAGKAPESLKKGTAARIFTGAEIPDGADTVAMQEDCRRTGESVSIDASQVRLADNVRPQGQDIRRGDTILTTGRRLRAQEMGLAFSIGQPEVTVFRPLRVAFLSTGDELVEPGTSLSAGQIYNSNRATLHGLLGSWGMDAQDLGIVRDDPRLIESVLQEAASSADVIVTSGGVSVGEEDHVKEIVETLGTLEFWKISIKPGKPLAFGKIGSTPFFGLPGNPASTFVTALLFLRTFLLSMQGAINVKPKWSWEISRFDKKSVKRQEFIRAKRVANGVDKYPNQSSGVLSSACWGDGLAVQPIGQTIKAGDRIAFYPYTEFH